MALLILNELFKSRFSDEVNAKYFITGSRPGQTNVLQRLIQSFMDAVRLFRKPGKSYYDVIHLNLSLNRNAVLRDSLLLLILRARKQHDVLVFS